MCSHTALFHCDTVCSWQWATMAILGAGSLFQGPNFAFYKAAIPAAAYSQGTRFMWHQPLRTRENYDVWAIDSINVVASGTRACA